MYLAYDRFNVLGTREIYCAYRSVIDARGSGNICDQNVGNSMEIRCNYDSLRYHWKVIIYQQLVAYKVIEKLRIHEKHFLS